MKYKPLFEVSLDHPYYENRRCPDVSVVASAETEALLRRHRAVWKARPNGAVVAVPVDSLGAPSVPFPADASLTFELHVVSADFHLITDTADILAIDAPVYTNPETETPLAVQVLNLVDRGTAERFDTRVLARIEITHLSTLTPSVSPTRFDIALTARSARWAYYVVTDVPAGTSTGVVRIVDTDPAPSGGALVFGEARDLVGVPDANDPVAAVLAARFPGKRRIRFVSDLPITRSERSRKYLELRVDDQAVAESLPNPSIAAYTKIDMEEPAPTDAWYGVIEYNVPTGVMGAV
jgi:hypothetical protein